MSSGQSVLKLQSSKTLQCARNFQLLDKLNEQDIQDAMFHTPRNSKHVADIPEVPLRNPFQYQKTYDD